MFSRRFACFASSASSAREKTKETNSYRACCSDRICRWVVNLLVSCGVRIWNLSFRIQWQNSVYYDGEEEILEDHLLSSSSSS